MFTVLNILWTQKEAQLQYFLSLGIKVGLREDKIAN